VTDAYQKGDNRFTGKIQKLAIDLKWAKAAAKEEENKARTEAAHKNAGGTTMQEGEDAGADWDAVASL
jgi:hypothetical protein